MACEAGDLGQQLQPIPRFECGCDGHRPTARTRRSYFGPSCAAFIPDSEPNQDIAETVQLAD